MIEQIAAQFSIATPQFVSWTIGLLNLRGDEWVLDAGCGQGAYLNHLYRAVPRGHLVGLDLSRDNLDAARTILSSAGVRAILLQGDVQALPFVDQSFDVVLANHMLYHVPDIGQALGEIWRVLRPGGYLLATTNSEHHLQEFWSLHWGAMADLGLGRPQARTLAAAQGSRFSLESGAALLKQYFLLEAQERWVEETSTTDIAALADYYSQSSTCKLVATTFARPSRRPALQEMLTERVRRRAEALIQQNGSLHLTKDAGAFVARKVTQNYG